MCEDWSTENRIQETGNHRPPVAAITIEVALKIEKPFMIFHRSDYCKTFLKDSRVGNINCFFALNFKILEVVTRRDAHLWIICIQKINTISTMIMNILKQPKQLSTSGLKDQSSHMHTNRTPSLLSAGYTGQEADWGDTAWLQSELGLGGRGGQGGGEGDGGEAEASGLALIAPCCGSCSSP